MTWHETIAWVLVVASVVGLVVSVEAAQADARAWREIADGWRDKFFRLAASNQRKGTTHHDDD